MSHKYSATCIYCNKTVFIHYFKADRIDADIVEVKQRGKYGRTLYAHMKCYMSQTRGAFTKN